MVQSTVSKGIELTRTGIPGLDDMLGGGLPRGRVVSVFGGPGTGKTTFSLQFLCNGFRLYDESGIYVSLDESPDDVRKNMSAYGWDLEELEKKGKLLLLDASLFKRLSRDMKIAKDRQGETDKDYSVVTLSNLIRGTIEKVGATRIAIDPMSTFVFQYPKLSERRLAVMDLLSTLRDQKNCTSLMVMDLRSSALEREYQLEEYLTQGTLILSTVSQPESGLTRVILIEKMKGVEHDTQPRPYAITKQGIRVFAKEKIYATGFQVH